MYGSLSKSDKAFPGVFTPEVFRQGWSCITRWTVPSSPRGLTEMTNSQVCSCFIFSSLTVVHLTLPSRAVIRRVQFIPTIFDRVWNVRGSGLPGESRQGTVQPLGPKPSGQHPTGSKTTHHLALSWCLHASGWGGVAREQVATGCKVRVSCQAMRTNV